MKKRCTVTHTAIILLAAMLLAGVAFAETAAPPAEAADTSAGAQAAPTEAADQEAIPERVTALEKENVILREDLGKARLDVKSDLQSLAERQAEAIARLNKELADLQAKLDAERAAQGRRNRNLWIAVGVVALGVMFAD